MIIVVARDRDLDLSLESEARNTLILVGIALAILLLATAAIFYWDHIREIMRRAFGLLRPIENMPVAEENAKFRPSNPNVSMPSASFFPSQRRAHKPGETQRPGFFNPIRKSASAPRRPAAVYIGANGHHGHGLPSQFRPGFAPQQMAATPTAAASQGAVSPHIAGLMMVADAVVGRHPNAQPLRARVATQAEIDLISGHVHIPWAFNGVKNSQPVPVKLQRPSIIHTPAPVKPGLLKDIGNIRGRDLLISVNNTLKRSTPKAKSVRRAARGKENVPPAPVIPAPNPGRRN